MARETLQQRIRIIKIIIKQKHISVVVEHFEEKNGATGTTQ